jgi:hypothetical protein
MRLRIWRAGQHEVAEAILRNRCEPRDEVTLETPTGASRWTVLSVEKHPHGWRTTATRCLPGCLDHPSSPRPP